MPTARAPAAAADAAAATSFPAAFYCPISQEVMRDPVSTPRGRTYERSSIEGWIRRGHANSPMSRLPLAIVDLVPNRSLQELISEAVSKADADAAEAKRQADAGAASASIRRVTEKQQKKKQRRRERQQKKQQAKAAAVQAKAGAAQAKATQATAMTCATVCRSSGRSANYLKTTIASQFNPRTPLRSLLVATMMMVVLMVAVVIPALQSASEDMAPPPPGKAALKLLATAITSGNVKIVDRLLTLQAFDVNQVVNAGTMSGTALWIASGVCTPGTNNSGMVARLLQHDDIDVNKAGFVDVGDADDISYGSSPLWIASYNGCTEAVKHLLAHPKVDVQQLTTTNTMVVPPLFIAALMHGRHKIVKLLLQHPEIKVNEGHSASNQTPLFVATDQRNTKVVKLLLAHDGVNVNARHTGSQYARTGSTALFVAATNGNTKVVQWLTQRDDLDDISSGAMGLSPLAAGCMQGKIKIVKMLLAKYSVPDVIDDDDVKRELIEARYCATFPGHSRTRTRIAKLFDPFLASIDSDEHEAIRIKAIEHEFAEQLVVNAKLVSLEEQQRINGKAKMVDMI